MVCPHCEGADEVFGYGYAKRDLKAYREKGASKTTNVMLGALRDWGVTGKTLLDIGGGIGAIQHELIASGLQSAVDVDASQAYITMATQEAERRGHREKIEFKHGDFVQLAPDLNPADIVTLDRVVCCYPDMHALIDLSSKLAQQAYALVYPRDNFLTRNGIHLLNFFAFRLSGNPFRTYIHDTEAVDKIIRGNGLERVLHKNVGFWQVFVYQR